MKVAVSPNVMPRSLSANHQHFEGTSYFHLQNKIVSAPKVESGTSEALKNSNHADRRNILSEVRILQLYSILMGLCQSLFVLSPSSTGGHSFAYHAQLNMCFTHAVTAEREHRLAPKNSIFHFCLNMDDGEIH